MVQKIFTWLFVLLGIGLAVMARVMGVHMTECECLIYLWGYWISVIVCFGIAALIWSYPWGGPRDRWF